MVKNVEIFVVFLSNFVVNISFYMIMDLENSFRLISKGAKESISNHFLSMNIDV